MDRFFEFLLYTPDIVPYFIAFGVLLACGIGLPIPEDLTLFTMGYLSYNGIVDIKISIAVCFLGVMLGDAIIFAIGHHYGSKLLRRGIFAKLLPPDRMKKTQKLFHRWGNKLIFAARFMPGLRAPTYFSAGALHLPFRVFVFYDGLAALLSVPLLTGVTYLFGEHIDWVINLARQAQYGVALLIAGLVAIFVLKHYISKRRRGDDGASGKKSSVA